MMRRCLAGLLLLFSCVVMAEPARAADVCGPLKRYPTDIRFNLEIPEPYYDTKMSLSQINQMTASVREEWLKKNGLQSVWTSNDLVTKGFAEGAFLASFGGTIDAVPYDKYGSYWCVFFRTFNAEIFYRTRIVIPKEFTSNPCVFKVVQEHELMHHEANKKAAEAYVEKLRQDIAVMLNYMEASYVAGTEAEKHGKDIQKAIEDAINVYFQQEMGKQANALNEKIDTPEEYEKRSVMMDDCGKSGKAP